MFSRFLKCLREGVGDFWWYSLMVFCAARAADFTNMFVGLWLVPKCVSPEELGAVQPLTSFASFLVVPAGVFATTFRQEISNLAVAGEFGKMKSLMSGVFIVAAVFFVFAVAGGALVLPAFLERIRIVDGSLGFTIILAAFIGTVSAVFITPLQALKKFKATSLINVIGAPIRLIVMVAAMPFRALTGYFVGQASTPAFSVLASVVALRKELSIPAEPYWSREVFRRFGCLFAVFAVSSLASGFGSLIESMIIRQRLSDLDSAAYYMVTRFSDIASYVSSALCFTVFPFAADLAARGKSTNRLVLKSSSAISLFNAVLAAVFWFFGEDVLRFLPHGEMYAAYAWAIPCMIAVTTMSACASVYTTAEISANRFGYICFYVPLNLLSGVGLLLVTGYGYFSDYLPVPVRDFLAEHNIRTLQAMIVWLAVFSAVRVVCCVVHAMLSARRARRMQERFQG